MTNPSLHPPARSGELTVDDETGPLSVDEREALVDWITRHRAEAGAAWASRLLAAYDTAYDAVATRSPAASVGEPAERPTPDITRAVMMSSDVLAALRLARDAHEGQRDKQGQPYALHALRVSLAGQSDEEQIVGALHDVVEDTPVTLDHIGRFFGLTIARAVEALTRRKHEAYTDYIERVAANPLATAVKLNDLRDNLSRAGGLWESARAKLVPRYQAAMARLSSPSVSGSVRDATPASSDERDDPAWSDEYWTLDQAVLDATDANRTTAFIDRLKAIRDTFAKHASSARVSEDAPKMECEVECSPAVVWLPFSAYELANLAAALMAIVKDPGPLNALNSGDWTAVTAYRFQEAQQRFAPSAQPNRTTENMIAASVAPLAELTALRADRDRLGEELEKERARNCSECGDRLSRSHLCYSCLFDRLRSLKESLSSSPSSATLEKPE